MTLGSGEFIRRSLFTMRENVRITFLQDVNTWEGYFFKGDVAECAKEVAEEWEAQGLISILSGANVTSEDTPNFQTAKKNQAERLNKNNHARANRKS